MNKSLWSRGKLLQLRSCPACGSADVKREFVRRDDNYSMPDSWRMCQCSSCGSVYLASRPDEQSLPLAYSDYFTHKAEVDRLVQHPDQGVLSRLINGYLNQRFGMHRKFAIKGGYYLFKSIPPLRMKLDFYGRHVPSTLLGRPANLLDVGCGNGAFLLRAREMGLDAQGCDPDSAAVRTCHELGLRVALGDVWQEYFNNLTFDYITLNQVIEHVSDAPKLLNRLFDLTSPGGYIWLGLPNPNALGLKVFEKGWKGLHPPFHLLIPDHDILKSWLIGAGYSDINFVNLGVQSAGLWRESAEIAVREGVGKSKWYADMCKFSGDVISSFSSSMSEETVVIARRSS